MHPFQRAAGLIQTWRNTCTTVGGYTYKLKADQMGRHMWVPQRHPHIHTDISTVMKKCSTFIHLNGITVLTQQGSWQRDSGKKIAQECQILQQRNVTSSSKKLHWPIRYLSVHIPGRLCHNSTLHLANMETEDKMLKWDGNQSCKIQPSYMGSRFSW